MGSQSSDKLTADAQIMDFLCSSPFRRDSQEGTEVKLLRQRDFEDFSGFQTATQEILKTVPAKAQALFLVISSDTLSEIRKYQGNGDFASGLGLDLRAPQLESYHSAFHGVGFDRVFVLALLISPTPEIISHVSYSLQSEGLTLCITDTNSETNARYAFLQRDKWHLLSPYQIGTEKHWNPSEDLRDCQQHKHSPFIHFCATLFFFITWWTLGISP
ncbi:hypothetical protein ASPCAL12982 [Aspergillus calidoustus]|uniref:Uncharacterized protein n=1 Tax=Aspergillus calidoustus TaxID=454130 RepID=A0A0U5GFI5_ASPCI|nr:hypothetical protein ASPCAL12982 [Aspergillus calidoustus]